MTSREECANSGGIYCCGSNQAITPTMANAYTALGLNAVVGQFVGSSCSPINIGAAGGGNTCAQQTLYCKDNQYVRVLSLQHG